MAFKKHKELSISAIYFAFYAIFSKKTLFFLNYNPFPPPNNIYKKQSILTYLL